MALTLTTLLQRFRPDPASHQPTAVQKALFLARELQLRAAQLETRQEKRQQARMARMLERPSDKATLAQMTDQAFRTSDPRRAVEHMAHILRTRGVPQFFSAVERWLLAGFRSYGHLAPGIALRLLEQSMRAETASVILPGERDRLTAHLARRQRQGVRMNVNFLGEAILSEAEAARRLEQYLAGLRWPEIEVVSIKISTLFSQISSLARAETISILSERLERLFRTAQEERFTRFDGQVVPKFVYLDMEEYRDMDLTAEAFMRALDRPGLEASHGGIALQSYIPDSFRTLLRVQRWARERVARGGGRITIRLVKGANLEMERVEASVREWPQAPHTAKLDTDASFKRMLHETLKPENLAAMDVGVASHNLFDLAYGLALAEERGALERVQFEMLEGMANHQRRALAELSSNLLLYAPACKRENFINAIGYLIRRLDENTGPENFLRHAFNIRADSPEWERLQQGFLESLGRAEQVSDAPRRNQDRNAPPEDTAPVADGWQRFQNEPDTDFSIPENAAWAAKLVADWQHRCGERATAIPAFAATSGGVPPDTRQSVDPSRPGVIVARYSLAKPEDVERAVELGAADPDGWRNLAVRARIDRLAAVAGELRRARGDLIGAAMASGGKTVAEADPEVSEAVDFVEFYRETARWWQEMPTLAARPKGLVVVVSPWNFPIAIPCGGVAAALAAGNTVILKPASDTVLVGWELCQCFWRAGVPRSALQFLPCSGGREGAQLVNHPKVAAVILTGGTETALSMLRAKPGLQLCAETGGKDATIVTGLADRDQAIKHILHSAFSHAGQKCSATSLLLLEAELYDDPAFRRGLKEAAESIPVGSAWNLGTRMGPLIRKPAGDLHRALTQLDPGEEWLLEPRLLENNPHLWSPGIKLGVKPGSYSHLTEFFGPVLSVMRFTSLPEAVELVNQTGYGLTSGLESLDERDWEYWREHIAAGNLYINRVTTGAIVLRQPFGGFGKSVFGPGMKAGGPNYVAQFMNFTDRPQRSTETPQDPVLDTLCATLRAAKHPDSDRLLQAAASYERAHRDEFSRSHDHFRLVGQDNFRRYMPIRNVRVRVHPDDSDFDVCARVCAARIAGSRVTVSTPPDLRHRAVERLKDLNRPSSTTTDVFLLPPKFIEFASETDDALAGVIARRETERVRYAAPGRVPAAVFRAAAEAFSSVISFPVSAEGRLELLWYLREQSVSIDYHRYGNLGARSEEPRAPVR